MIPTLFFVPPESPVKELQDSYAAVMRRVSGIDDKEMDERQEAAQAYAGENEQHFVDYCNDNISQSVSAKKETRRIQENCYRVFKEKEPAPFAKKPAWQSRITIPKPFASVMYGVAAVKKAFTPDFLSIRDEKNKVAEYFWKTVLLNQLSKNVANFPVKFADSAEMALAIGEGMEIIPKYKTGKGLSLELVPPWHIQRDPDAPPRDSQGGMYWIHQEWLDYFVLKQGEVAGKYFDVARVKELGDENPNNPFMTKEAIARRKSQIYNRNKFRSLILTSEFWGIVLSPNGEMLLPSATFTVAGGRVIEKPRVSPYKKLRWPGITTSALPDLLKSGGRGLLEGITSLWEAMCILLCLYEDAMKWLVNPPVEIMVDGLIDPTDIDDWPGKKYLTKATPQGQQVVRTIQRPDKTPSLLANFQWMDQNFQRGSFVTDAVQGLPGYRKDITARESQQNLEQSMGVFGLMGSNLEDGAIDVVWAAKDVIEAYASAEDFRNLLTDMAMLAELTKGGTAPLEFPALTGSFSISGVEALMKDVEIIKTITQQIIPLSGNQIYGPYIRPHKVLKAIERRTNLTDEQIIVDDVTALAIQKRIETEAQNNGKGSVVPVASESGEIK